MILNKTKSVIKPKSSTSKNTNNKQNATNTTNATKTTLKKVKRVKETADKKALNVSYKKINNVKYVIQVSTSKKFPKKKTKTYKTKKTKFKIKKLRAKKRYYIRVRASKKIKGKTVYGKWSSTIWQKTK